jgi:hypothetical protein
MMMDPSQWRTTRSGIAAAALKAQLLYRVRRWIPAVAIAAGIVGWGAAARAALMFDVTSAGSSVASGYTALNIPSGGSSGSATVGTVGVTLSSGTSNSGRTGRGPTPTDDLLDDMLYAVDPGGLTFTFTGLQPGTTYKFTVYSADNTSISQGDVSAFYQGSSTTPFLSGVKVVVASSSRAAAEYTGILAPLAGDTLSITSKITSGSGFLLTVVNGFELDVVPEPGSLALLGLGALVFLPRRRRWNSRAC